MNKSSKISNFTTYNGETKEEEKAKNSWKKSNTSDAVKNSTLSLHIAAYENSFEADVPDQLGSQNNEDLTEKRENTKFDALTFFIQVI